MNSRCTCMILCIVFYMFFFKQKTAYEMRISDWSSDVCSSDLNLRKQWHQELQDKFNLQGSILEAKSYNALRKHGQQPFRDSPGPVICSYQFAKSKDEDIKAINWDLVVLDEAHRSTEERRVGKEGVSTCRSRGWTYHSHNKRYTD